MFNKISVEVIPTNLETFTNIEYEYIKSFDLFFKQTGCKRKKNSYEFSYYGDSDRERVEYIMQFLVKAAENLKLRVYVKPCYEKKDFEIAKAFMINSNNHFEYYDGWYDEKYSSFNVYCHADNMRDLEKVCGVRRHKSPIFAKPVGKTIKKIGHDLLCATSDESYGVVISDYLKDKLLENGVDSHSFTPVYKRNGEQWGWMMINEEHLLSCGTVKNNLIGNRTKCNRCGYWHSRYIMDILNARYEDIHNLIVFRAPTIIEKWTISDTGLEQMKDINVTEEFICGVRRPVFSKQVVEILRSEIPQFTNMLIPVFLEK